MSEIDIGSVLAGLGALLLCVLAVGLLLRDAAPDEAPRTTCLWSHRMMTEGRHAGHGTIEFRHTCVRCGYQETEVSRGFPGF